MPAPCRLRARESWSSKCEQCHARPGCFSHRRPPVVRVKPDAERRAIFSETRAPTTIARWAVSTDPSVSIFLLKAPTKITGDTLVTGRSKIEARSCSIVRCSRLTEPALRPSLARSARRSGATDPKVWAARSSEAALSALSTFDGSSPALRSALSRSHSTRLLE